MFKSKYGTVGPGPDRVADTRVDNSVCPNHGVKMTLLFTGYVCDICDPPKKVESKPMPPSWDEREKRFQKDMFGVPRRIVLNGGSAPSKPLGTSFTTPKNTVPSRTWYTYSTKDGKTKVDGGYKLYDDLQYLKGKCTKKAARSGSKYYIYQIDEAGEDFIEDVAARRPVCNRDVDVGKVWETT